MVKLLFVSGGLGLLLAAVSAWFGRGTDSHAMLTFIPAVWVGVPMLLLALIIRVASTIYSDETTRNQLIWSAKLFFAGGLFLALQLTAYFGGRLFTVRDIEQAQEYCESLFPRLELFKGEHGAYPLRIEELSLDPDDYPRLLEGRVFYYSGGKTYRFEFEPPPYTSAGGGLAYESDRKQWVRWD